MDSVTSSDQPPAKPAAGSLVERARQTSKRLMHIASVIEYRSALAPAGGLGANVILTKMRDTRVARRLSPLALSLLLLVALPTLLGGIYFGFIASDQYASEIRLSIRNVQQKTSDNLSSLLAGGPHISSALPDLYLISNFLNSREAVEEIDRKLDLRKIYASKSIDVISRLKQDASVDELVEYWRNMLSAGVDMPANALTVEVRAFSPQDALNVTKVVVASSEALINGMSERAYKDAMRNSAQELGEAERRLATLRKSLNEYRDKVGLLNPIQSADVTVTAIAKLQDERMRILQDLAVRANAQRASSPVVASLRARLAALDGQIAELQNQITTRSAEAEKGQTLSAVMAKFDELQTETQFAQKSYESALATNEKARLEADRQHFFVVPFVQPMMPETPKYPRRVLAIVLTFLVSFAAWGILALGYASVRDHAL